MLFLPGRDTLALVGNLKPFRLAVANFSGLTHHQCLQTTS